MSTAAEKVIVVAVAVAVFKKATFPELPANPPPATTAGSPAVLVMVIVTPDTV